MFLELHSVAFDVVRMESRRKGYQLTEQPLADGSVQLLIREDS